jgi:RNA polymerase sigma-70 factor (ECF subfamily)
VLGQRVTKVQVDQVLQEDAVLVDERLVTFCPVGPYQGVSISTVKERMSTSTEPREPSAAGRTGELAGFEAELAPLLGAALRLATGMLMNTSDAEDAVQEACLRAWDRRDNRRPGTELRPWFLAIVANRCRETRRSRWMRSVRLGDVPRVESDAADGRAAALDVRRALGRLPYRARLAVVARYYLDLPHEEVASLLGCSADAAKAAVHRATRQLQACLPGSEEEP